MLMKPQILFVFHLDQTPSPFALPMHGGTMTINQPFDYRNPQATPSPQPAHPFSVSPQPYQTCIPPFDTASLHLNPPTFSGLATPLINPTFPDNGTFPLTQMPPLIGNTPVSVDPNAQPFPDIQIFSQSDLNNMSIDPIESFNPNSGEIRRILLNHDFSMGLSSEQSRDPRYVDEKGLSDSFSGLLNN